MKSREIFPLSKREQIKEELDDRKNLFLTEKRLLIAIKALEAAELMAEGIKKKNKQLKKENKALKETINDLGSQP